jgi:Protein of unknown function (DUF3047)
MRSSACLLAVLLVAGCASTPDDDPLVWSDDVMRTLPRERGEVVEVARFSRLRAGDSLAPWEPWIILRGNTPTTYRVAEVDGVAALEADSAEGGSGMWRKIRIDPHAQPLMEWRWRVPAEVETRLEKNSSKSPAVRLSLAFHGDPAKLDFDDRVKLRMARALTVNGLPYASLLYVWMVGVPVDTVLHSPHTDRVRMIVAESGVKRAGEWVTVRRNVVEDFRRAFGEEPDDIVGVGLMTDYGDDGSRRRAFYGDITFRSGP